ncbi:molybdopterin-binding protein [Meridianimarinicoccus sp. RP-17]|uniref:molybdopterin-binding protein n=1 Tax=Meridianimarinicoccus zhengii TaxID=2056810 RepID=UPI000DACBE3A|nr:molybdopterin-binding protein [Phycocomes zhengii]
MARDAVAFDRVAVLDWSSAGVPTRGRDSIWLGVADAAGIAARNLPTRAAAEAALHDLVRDSVDGGARLLLGVDFPLGYPDGFARALTGSDDPLAVWDWLAARITDGADNRHNLRDVAAMANAVFPGAGPFWGNGAKAEVPGLSRTKPALPPGLAAHRTTEAAARAAGARPKTVWQLAGAGSVGAQALVGLPVLHRLRRAHGAQLTVWPFAPPTAPVVMAEVYPSLLADTVAAACARDPALVRDAAQVRLLAAALLRLSRSGGLGLLFDQHHGQAPREGWILGVGAEATLRGAVPALDADDGTIPVDAAHGRMRTALRPVTGVEDYATQAATGRVLARTVTARRAHPAQDNAAVDGYGFGHAATGAGAQRLPLVAGRAAAGRPFAEIVPQGAALRVLTGALLPGGVDTVLPDEDVAVDGAEVAFDGPVTRGANIRQAGEDMAAGAPALPEGHQLRAPDLALLTALGVATVPVRRRLRVGVLSTGDEVVPDPDRPAVPHAVWDANRPMLLSLVAGWGHAAVDLGHAADDASEIAARLDDGAARCDAILTSGGASAGDEDHLAAILRARGRLSVRRVALKPGRPFLFGAWRDVPVLGLPGNPVAALVCALVFGHPALSMLAGSGWPEPAGFAVPAAFARDKAAGRREFLRARLNAGGAAEVFAGEGSGRISGLAWATGLVDLPEGACRIRPGDPVRFLPYASFGV